LNADKLGEPGRSRRAAARRAGDPTETGMSTKTQILISLSLLAILDAVIPIPITAMMLIMVLFQKPRWFKEWVDKVYRS
jgi:hypothetical protein